MKKFLMPPDGNSFNKLDWDELHPIHMKLLDLKNTFNSYGLLVPMLSLYDIEKEIGEMKKHINDKEMFYYKVNQGLKKYK